MISNKSGIPVPTSQLKIIHVFFTGFCCKDSCTTERIAHLLHIRALNFSFLGFGSTLGDYGVFLYSMHH